MHPSPSTTNQVIDRNESGGIIGKKRSKMTAKGANKNFYTHIFGAMRCREMFFTIFAIKSRNSRPDNIKTDTIDMTINETQDEIIDEFEGNHRLDGPLCLYNRSWQHSGGTSRKREDSSKPHRGMPEPCVDFRIKNEDRIIHFEADSGALIVKGIVATCS